ncbi:MAG: ribonuclease PH [Clostridia bacterium]|nr:ribonuclease PH [Clostridia bacterium]
MRFDGRKNDEMRKVNITTGYIKHPEGSVLIEFGDTKVICNATVEEKVPPHVKDTGKGWVTAEYSMLPRATGTRNQRDISKLKISPRSAEIQRLVGRSLRGVCDMEKLGERSIIVDCDVIQADGGTRTASITGGYVALYLACQKLVDAKIIKENPVKCGVCAVSVGIYNDEVITDLCYVEDSNAQVDLNAVMTEDGNFVEIQGTGEGRTFSEEELLKMLSNAKKACGELTMLQKEAISKGI